MAIENAKTLNVRIKNKYDSYENWAKSGLVLEAGEIAIAYTTVNVEVGNGKIETHPELLMKVGDGEKTFANLPWLSAKAADVAAWAKAKDKPTYEAKEITGIADYIAEYVEDTMGITVDTNTVYRTVKVDDYNYKLQSKGAADADTAWADVADSVIVIPNDTAAIEALQTLVGDTEVATQIENAITALDLANTYAAKTHTHTKSEITDFAHTHEIADVNGLQGALDGKQAVGDYATKAEAQGYADAKDTVIAEAKKAGTDAQAYAEGVAGDLADYETANDARVKAVEDSIGTVAEGKTVVGMIADAQTAATYDDTEVKADIAALEGLVGDTAVATQIDNALKIDGVDKYGLATDVKANTDAIATLNGNSSVDGSVDKKVADAINAFATQVSDDKTVNTYKELIEYAATHGSEFTELVGEVDANAKAIETLNGDSTVAGSVDKKIADAIAAENLSQYATDTELKDVNDRLAAVEGDYLKAADKTELQTAINAKAAQTDLDKAEEAIAGLQGLVGDTAVNTQITNAITALDLANTYEAKGEAAKVQGALDAYIEANDEAVGKKANDADLAAVAKSGLVDDLTIGEGTTLVFDCGNASV